MVDWLTHSLIGWITGKTIKQEISLIVIGSLIPDIFKSYLLVNWFIKGDTQNFFLPLHTPFGAILIAGIFALFFPNIKETLIPLGIGITTHFILDLTLLNVSGGILLLYPFSWNEWQLGLIRSDDYTITAYATIITFVVFTIYFLKEKIIKPKYQLNKTLMPNINNKNALLYNTKKGNIPSISPSKINPQLYYIKHQKQNQLTIKKYERQKHTQSVKKTTNNPKPQNRNKH
jgi:hypothetical protein